jgi:lipopolysaccharide export system permease protein
MKVLYRYILKSFIGPLALTLIIALFILLMQFLWKYIDDLVGKGLSAYVIAKLMVLATVTLIPMALPLAILLASIMTFGNLAENHELVCMKSAGLSLPRILLPLTIFIFMISVSAFFFANNVLPFINLKMGALLYDVRTAKPALNIRQDIFYNGIEGYSIRIGQKDENQETIHNILIYDHSSNDGDTKVTLAKDGTMKMSSDKQYLILIMNNGNSYQEMTQPGQRDPGHPFTANRFDKQTVYFDLSSFKFSRTNEELFKNNYEMLNIKQLTYTADSMDRNLDRDKEQFYAQINQSYYTCPKNIGRSGVQQPNTLAPNPTPINQSPTALLDVAINIARNAKEYTIASKDAFNALGEDILRRRIEWHRKFTFSFACFILFFIGAPLGAIIKKGGLGMPVVISTVFFIIFYIISITGEKFAREQVTTLVQGMWMPVVILFPIAILLTYKASVDSRLFDKDAYLNIGNRIIGLFRKKKTA